MLYVHRVLQKQEALRKHVTDGIIGGATAGGVMAGMAKVAVSSVAMPHVAGASVIGGVMGAVGWGGLQTQGEFLQRINTRFEQHYPIKPEQDRYEYRSVPSGTDSETQTQESPRASPDVAGSPRSYEMKPMGISPPPSRG